MPRKMTYQMEAQVPIAVEGQGNKDFTPKLPGHDFRQPRADPQEAMRLRQQARETKDATQQLAAQKPASTIASLDGSGQPVDANARESRQKGLKAAPRWNPAQWYQAPSYEQVPLQREEGATWNSLESQKVQGALKGQDRLMRSVRRPEDVRTPESPGAGAGHPLDHDREEYYPGRSNIDSAMEETGNDFQVRPANLPDFHNPPPPGADHVARMRRLREVIKQRYGGRPRLMGVFRSCSLTKPGIAFPKDLQQVFDQMGIKVDERECEMLVRAVDKDQKGAMTFEEFADLIYGPNVEVGGPEHLAQERHVHHVTKTLVDGLVRNGQALGKAFCELDPERHYVVSKAQFANAVGTACNHISKQAVDFLWASQFPGEAGSEVDGRCVDWRDFMSQLAHFSQDNRAPTPICVQGRKRQYDLLQRTAPITGGVAPDLDLNRPEQNAADEVHLVADHLEHRQTELPHKPREAALLTEPFVEGIRAKAGRVESALPALIPRARLQELLADRQTVHQDDLASLLCKELEAPLAQQPLQREVPLYASYMPQAISAPAEAPKSHPQPHGDAPAHAPAGRANLKLVPADIHSFIATQRTNRDHHVDVESFITNVYKPEDERKAIDRVNDGLNRALRGLRPPRERPPHSEVPRHENYWQARYMMEMIGEGIAAVENSNGGKLQPSKMFKRLDIDGDGYISLSDLRTACEKYKVQNTSADLHAIFSELDKNDKGSVDIGEFARSYEVHQGSLLDSMAMPIKAVYCEGGVQRGGPVQEQIDAREREVAAAQGAAGAAGRCLSAPPSSAAGSPGSDRGSAARSQMSRAGASIAQLRSPGIYEQEVSLITGTARVSDIIRARCALWKPGKTELYTSPARTRYGLTVYPDTRHITEANVPLSASYMDDAQRFKTTNSLHSLFAVPDARNPRVEDDMQRHARNEFRVERIRQRQRHFADRCWAANEAAQEFDEQKVARKALNLLNYERKCRTACA